MRLHDANERPRRVKIDEEEREAALRVVQSERVAVFVVAYNAEAQIQDTLERIPSYLWEHLAEVYVIDDQSSDATLRKARELIARLPRLKVYRTPVNQGYGGNQKLGYAYAIDRDFDIVVLLHGDGQYAPEALPRILAPLARIGTDAVLGSRMMAGAAGRRGMPFYKWIGNVVLTAIENRLLGTRLSEFHSGYRAFRVSALREIPFRHNTNDFHFDTEIIVQLLFGGRKIVEVPIPAYSSDEIRLFEGWRYAWNCLATIVRALANRLYLVYHPKFDVQATRVRYSFKTAATSVHQAVLGLQLEPNSRVLELGAGQGDVCRRLHERGYRVLAIDQTRPQDDPAPFDFLVADLDTAPWRDAAARLGGPADYVLALDVLEHLRDPERAAREIHAVLKPGGTLIASTGNVAFVVLRLMMLFGQFNYGKKGILDLTHHRLFSIRSFKRLLQGEGYRIRALQGFGPPIVDMIGRSWLLRMLDRAGFRLARLWPSLFAYQILVVAERLDSVSDLLSRTAISAD